MIGSFELVWFMKRFVGDGEMGVGSKGVMNEYDEEFLRDLSMLVGSERW